MLVSAEIANVASVQKLIKLWANRYNLNLSPLLLEHPPFTYGELVEASSASGRAATAARMEEYMIDFNSELAAFQAKSLYEYVPGVINLRQARQLIPFVAQVYRKLLKLYQQSSPVPVVPLKRLLSIVGDASYSAWGIPNIEELADTLEPVLMELQEQHIAAADWRTLGFITTQFNFNNQLLLAQLTPVEQTLIHPYLKFVEEQVALPWQRVCAAAAQHDLSSPAFILVEQMFPRATEIADTVFQQLSQKFPDHRSRRGSLDNPEVAHSCVRDLQMFQAYLWLCVLEGNLNAIEQELVDLCVMVMKSVEVRWELIERWNQELIDEILSHLSEAQQTLLLPYVEGVQEIFDRKRILLGSSNQ